MSHFRHILVPLDFTPKNQPAVDVARQLAADGGPKTRVTLLHVIEPIAGAEEGEDDAEVRSFFDRLEDRAERELARRRADVASAGVEVTSRVVYGSRAEQIVQLASDEDVDLIVLSSRPLDPSAPPTWPTISSRVALLSPKPVMLVR